MESRKKGGDKITVKEIIAKLNISPIDFAKQNGICKSAFYNKLNGKTDWALKELISMSKYGELKIQADGKWYKIKIREIPE